MPPVRPRCETRWPLCTRVVSAWRSVEREIPSSFGEVALGGQLAAGGEQAEADGGSKPLDGLLERGRRANRLEHRLEGGVAIHGLRQRYSRSRRPANRRGGIPSAIGSPVVQPLASEQRRGHAWSTNLDYDVAIVGAGVVGAAIARELLATSSPWR